MDGWSAAWLAWAAAFCAIEGAALVAKDRPGRPATLSALRKRQRASQIRRTERHRAARADSP